MAYDFSTLDSNDFELLARDLLNHKFGLDLQNFKAGKDRGIDLRISTPENKNAVIVQGKHYLKSGFSTLFGDLERKELPKIKALKPGRYMLVTSLELNPQEKDKLFKLLYPHLQSTSDIFGKEDLNKYLSDLPDIEIKWYKLWLTSIPVLTKVLQNGILGTNEFVASKILKTTKMYVPCPNYEVAFNILKEHKYLLITGQPGVGKTTLAYYLTYNLLANGFQLLHVDTDIAQASNLLSNDPAIKQIVFFDDFLGETYLEINRPKTTESAFALFLERIMTSENKYLILTTRTTIYNNALYKFEKLERMKVSVARREIVLDQYSILDKARILHKHIYFADIESEYKEEIYNDKHYWAIIEHNNYNPRIIEFITSKKHIPKDLPTGYLRFVLNNLDNPKEVWRYFYQEQINVEERILLHVVFTQNSIAKTADTKMMFAHMLHYEIETCNYRAGLNPFQNALKRLLDGTLKQELSVYSLTDRITFINPSLTDFLKHYFFHSEEERHKLLKGSCVVEQFEYYKQTFLSSDSAIDSIFIHEFSMFASLLLDQSDKLKTYAELKRENNREKYIKIRVAAILDGQVTLDTQLSKRITLFIYEAVKNYPIDGLNAESRDYFCKILKFIAWDPTLYKYVEDNWTGLINGLFLSCVKEGDFEDVKSLFSAYGKEYSGYLCNEDNAALLADCLRDLADGRTSEWIRDDRSGILSEADWKKLKGDVTEKRRLIFKTFNLEDDWFDEQNFFDIIDVEELIEKNTARKKGTKNAQLANTQLFATTADEDLVKEVEILFCGEFDSTFVKKKAEEMGLPF